MMEASKSYPKMTIIAPRKSVIDEAFQINFGEEFVKLGATYISHIFNLKTVSLSFNPPLKKKPTPNSLVYQNACVMGDLEGLAQFCYEERTKKKLVPYYKQHFLNIFKTRADVEKQMLIEHTISINELYIESDGEKFYVTSITFMLIGIPTTQDIAVKHRTYEGALITEAIFNIKQMDNIHTAWIAQLPKNKEAKVFVKSKPRRKKKMSV